MNFLYLTLSSLLLGFLSAWLAALAQLPLSRVLDRTWPRRFSSGFWFAWAMLAPSCGAAASLFVIASGLLSGSGWVEDHCLVHPGHPHLCLNHILQNPPGGGPFWFLLGPAWLGLAWGCRRVVRLWRATRRWVAGATPVSVAGQQVWRTAGSLPAAFTAGLWFPRLYWTRRALELLRDQEREIVLSHEAEHRRRRDPLRLLLLEWRRVWLPGGGHLMRRWEQQAEIECDRACLRKGFDPGAVAAAILKVHKEMSACRRESLVAAYARHDPQVLRMRIESLYEQRGRRFGAVAPAAALGLLLTLLVSRFSQMHHVLETVLGWLR